MFVFLSEDGGLYEVWGSEKNLGYPIALFSAAH